MGHVVAVVGLKREAAVLRGLDVVTIAGGGAPERLRRELTEAARGADGIVSFGMAGALDPNLAIGDWVIGERVGTITCDAQWIAELRGRMPQARLGPIYADGRLIADPVNKAILHRASGVLAADMESHIAAEIADSLSVPLAVLRCISDEAGAALPAAIAVAMKPDGGLALRAVLGSVLSQPRQLPQLLHTVRQFGRAYAALRIGARRTGVRLAFPGLASHADGN